MESCWHPQQPHHQHRNRAGEEIQHSGFCWSEAEILNRVVLINLEQLLHFFACDTPTPTPPQPNSLALRLQRVSHVKMLMKCLTRGNTRGLEH